MSGPCLIVGFCLQIWIWWWSTLPPLPPWLDHLQSGLLFYLLYTITWTAISLPIPVQLDQVIMSCSHSLDPRLSAARGGGSRNETRWPLVLSDAALVPEIWWMVSQGIRNKHTSSRLSIYTRNLLTILIRPVQWDLWHWGVGGIFLITSKGRNFDFCDCVLRFNYNKLLL